MVIEFDFSALWKQVGRLGGERVEIEWQPVSRAEPIDIELAQGREIELDSLDIVNGLLSVDGRQVLLYIPDQYGLLDDVEAEPEKGKRFHVADCKTLENMRHKRRFDRYIVTNDVSGLFKISGRRRQGGLDEIVSKLCVCKYCLQKLNYKNYLYGSRNDVWRKFKLEEFFETFSTSFRYMPRKFANRQMVNEYTADWDDVSLRVRQKSNFQCEQCRLDLSENQHLLHAHHINGVKSDNSPANLRSLCVDCHRKQPFHSHMYVRYEHMQILTRLRREQDIKAADWNEVFELADQAIHGALHHARHLRAGVPEVGYDLVGAGGTVVGMIEAAWPEKRVGIYVGKRPSVTGWTLMTTDEFLSVSSV